MIKDKKGAKGFEVLLESLCASSNTPTSSPNRGARQIGHQSDMHPNKRPDFLMELF
jgi:hypothetical protein